MASFVLVISKRVYVDEAREHDGSLIFTVDIDSACVFASRHDAEDFCMHHSSRYMLYIMDYDAELVYSVMAT